MTRTHLVTVVGVILLALIFAYSQGPQRTSQPAQTATQSEPNQPPKAKKILVKELPKELAGMTLQNGVFKLAPGYKFVPKTNGSVAVALRATGAVSGTFDCLCLRSEGGPKQSGNCKVKLNNESTTLSCVKDETNPCSDTCFLDSIVKGTSMRLAIF